VIHAGSFKLDFRSERRRGKGLVDRKTLTLTGCRIGSEKYGCSRSLGRGPWVKSVGAAAAAAPRGVSASVSKRKEEKGKVSVSAKGARPVIYILPAAP
jgi:hypothetical protein